MAGPDRTKNNTLGLELVTWQLGFPVSTTTDHRGASAVPHTDLECGSPVSGLWEPKVQEDLLDARFLNTLLPESNRIYLCLHVEL